MKLTSTQVEDAVNQLQVSAIAESADIVPELTQLYGDHTFFIDPDGLHILERLDEDQPADGRDKLSLVQLAAWTDDTRSAVATHEPRNTGKTVTTDDGSPSPAA